MVSHAMNVLEKEFCSEMCTYFILCQINDNRDTTSLKLFIICFMLKNTCFAFKSHHLGKHISMRAKRCCDSISSLAKEAHVFVRCL